MSERNTESAVSSAGMLPSPLDTMATEMVGDGKEPNLFFVSDRGAKVCAVFPEEGTAVRYAQRLGYYVVEDRLCGEVWASEERDRKGVS